MSDASQTNTEVLEQQDIKEPDFYKVILHNDDVTTMEFVVDLLCRVFHKNPDTAYEIMMTVHNTGRGICGVFTQEIAETKVNVVRKDAREAGFPLKCTMEKV